MHRDVCPLQRARGSAQESHSLGAPVRSGTCHRRQERERNARRADAAAHVEPALTRRCARQRRDGQRVGEQEVDEFIGAARGRQIDALVPSHRELAERAQLGRDLGRERVQLEMTDRARDPRFKAFWRRLNGAPRSKLREWCCRRRQRRLRSRWRRRCRHPRRRRRPNLLRSSSPRQSRRPSRRSSRPWLVPGRLLLLTRGAAGSATAAAVFPPPLPSPASSPVDASGLGILPRIHIRDERAARERQQPSEGGERERVFQ